MLSISQLTDAYNKFVADKKFEGHPQSLYSASEYAMKSGGKKLRPLFVLAACQLFSKDYSQSLNQAYAIELFHNFTLVHDDIMDNASLRRGNKTVFQLYGQNLAVLSGDLLLIKAYKYLQKNLPANSNFISDVFNHMAIEVCEGQQLDLEFENRSDVSLSEYMVMIEKKTAALLAAAFKIGAIVGGSSESQSQHLFEFGKHLGLAFQLQDDYLDTYGSTETFGKEIGGDIFQNKKTWLNISLRPLVNDFEKEEIDQWMNKTSFDKKEKLLFFKSLYSKHEIDQRLSEEVQLHYTVALDNLKTIPDADLLRDIATTLIQRNT